MARMARLVVPGHPHHVTQRGVRGMEVFACPDDYRAYLDLLTESCGKAGTQVWAYCLMSNHIHLILVPSTEDGLRAALGEAHRQYTRLINLRDNCRGHLWQERFHSFVMDEGHALACARYVELNPVAANIVEKPEDYTWSSAKAHVAGADDMLVRVEPLLSRMPDWAGFLESGVEEAERNRLHQHSGTGRPLGAEDWIGELEEQTGRRLKARLPGRPKKAET
ncbi:MAG: transposase [Rhodospirillales bacterium]|nr:transposase [Rhodospirillales bacterium]